MQQVLVRFIAVHMLPVLAHSMVVLFHHHLYVIITTVNQEALELVYIMEPILLVILCGMGEVVVPVIAVVPSLTFHGSIVKYRWPVMITLKQEYVMINHLEMKLY